MISIAEQIAVMEAMAGGRPGTTDILATLRWLEPNAGWIRRTSRWLISRP